MRLVAVILILVWAAFYSGYRFGRFVMQPWKDGAISCLQDKSR